MHVAIEKTPFHRELGIVHAVIERKATIPILSYVRIEARQGMVVLTGTDLDVSVRVRCEAEVKEEGTVCVSARKLFDIVRALSDGPIVMAGTEDRITLMSGRSRFRLAGLPVEDFPDIPEVPSDGGIELHVSDVQTAIRRVIFATSPEKDQQYALSGVNMEWGEGRVRMVATDRRRLALCEWNAPCENKKRSALIPRKAVYELRRITDDMDGHTLELYCDENHVYARVGHRELVSRLLTGQFPNYELVIPKEAARRVVVSAPVWREALRRVALLSDERSRAVRLQFSSSSMVLTAWRQNNDEEATEEVVVVYEGEPLEIAFNSEYLADFLDVVEGDVEVGMTNADSAAKLAPIGDEMTYVYVVMPMRLA
jgi:DNA polymerase-3 subunit beta